MTSCEHCENPVLARGWCTKHYERWRNHGDPLMIKTMRGLPEEERFWRQVSKTATCWPWTGSIVRTYGYFRTLAGPAVPAHRYAYELLVGPIPAGLEIDHTCHDPATCIPPCTHRICVNPDHLEAVTRKENNRRSGNVGAVNAAKTHCPHGHEYTTANTYRGTRPNGGRYRRCRTCDRDRAALSVASEQRAEEMA